MAEKYLLGEKKSIKASLSEGQAKLLTVAGQKLMLYRLSDGFYATSHQCTHLYKSMAKGLITSDQTIQCPLHRAEFDIRSGEVEQWACFPKGLVDMINVVRKEKALKTFAISEDSQGYWIEI